MNRATKRNVGRKASLDPKAITQPQLKNSNIIKTRMQSQNNLIHNAKNNRNPAKFANQTNLPQPSCLNAKLSISRSEEDTKVTELDQSENYISRELSQNKPQGNPELQIYREDIEAYVLVREEKYMIDHGYLRNHKLLSFKMRSYLVRHIFKVCLKFKLKRQTLYLAVHYMDLYFSRNYTFRDQFEMVSLAQACLFMAMKYEEIYPPDLAEWVDHRHKGEIIRLEAEVLHSLDFQLAHYTLENFLHFSLWKKTPKGSQSATPSDRTLLLMDLSLFDLTMRQFKPSKLAQCLCEMGEVKKGEKSEETDRLMVQNVKWMVERNKEAMDWLLDHNYRHLGQDVLD